MEAAGDVADAKRPLMEGTLDAHRTAGVDVKRLLWIVVVDLAIREGGGRLNVKHDFSPIFRTAQVLEF